MNRLVIDTDPGIDDAHAILMAFAHPETEVQAITTVAGNVSLDLATRNALTVLEVAEKDVPVYPGCEQALVSPTPKRAISHGTDGLGDSGYPNPARQAASEHAAQALIRLANLSPDELTLVAIGPLTNLALATRLDPMLPEKYKRLVVMGGAVLAKGNSWERAAEFNFYCDPESAAVVLAEWPGLTLVPWETCLANGLPVEKVQQIAQGESPRAQFFGRTINKRFIEQAPGRQVLSVPDPLAMAISLEPGIILRSEKQYVEVELAGQLTRGQTVVDWYGLTGRPPNVNIVYEVDRERFWELLRLSFA